MIYIKHIAEAQTLLIPRNGEVVTGNMILSLRNTTTLEEVTLSVMDIGTSGHYFNVAVTLPEDIVEGEHEYRLTHDSIEVSCGLLHVGELNCPGEYENTITYKEYGTE